GAILIGPLAVFVVSHGKIHGSDISLVLSLLACGFVASTLYVPFANSFFALKTTRYLFLLTMSSAAVSVGLNLMLIPLLGPTGAATSLLIAYTFLLSLAVGFARRGLGLRTFALQIAGVYAVLFVLAYVAQAWIYR